MIRASEASDKSWVEAWERGYILSRAVGSSYRVVHGPAREAAKQPSINFRA